MKVLSDEIEGIRSAAEVLVSGGVAIVPTETFYGVSVDPRREEAVRRVFRIKRRDETTPLPLIAANEDVVRDWTVKPAPLTVLLMKHFWPGSLTILFEPSRAVSRMLAGETGRIGIRVPPPCPARLVASHCGGLITATSANLSGEPEADLIMNIAPQMLEEVDIILDLGRTPGGLPSTVVEPLADSVRIIREGAVPRHLIDRVLALHVGDLTAGRGTADSAEPNGPESSSLGSSCRHGQE